MQLISIETRARDNSKGQRVPAKYQITRADNYEVDTRNQPLVIRIPIISLSEEKKGNRNQVSGILRVMFVLWCCLTQ